MSEVEQQQNINQNQQENPDEHASNTQSISAAILLMLSLLLINEMALSYVNKWKQKYKRMSILQPTTVTTTIGLLAGLLLNLTDIINVRDVMKDGFSSFFLIVLLPPILYESAINMERELFFKNFGSIIIYAIFGTLIATIATAFMFYGITELLNYKEMTLTASVAFGALISATDPVAVLAIFKELGVDSTLFSLIFGESILNDAVAIILFDTSLESFTKQTNVGISILKFLSVFLGSIVIGILIGMICAYALKFQNKNKIKSKYNKESQDNRETTILFVVPYVSYLISEGLNMSGIVSIMFCGIVMARYALENVKPSTVRLNKKLYHTLAYSCENLVFLFMGIGFVSFDLAWKQAGFWIIFLTCIILLLSRAINIASISYLLNYYRVKTKINKKYQFFLWFSGFRGAMAFALALKAREKFVSGEVGAVMLTITLVFCMINIFINATVLEPLIVRYDIQQKSGPQNLVEEGQDAQQEQQVTGFWNKVKKYVELCDQNCLQKILLNDKSQQQDSNYNDDDLKSVTDIELQEKQIKEKLIDQKKEDSDQKNDGDEDDSNGSDKKNQNQQKEINLNDKYSNKEMNAEIENKKYIQNHSTKHSEIINSQQKIISPKSDGQSNGNNNNDYKNNNKDNQNQDNDNDKQTSDFTQFSQNFSNNQFNKNDNDDNNDNEDGDGNNKDDENNNSEKYNKNEEQNDQNQVENINNNDNENQNKQNDN